MRDVWERLRELAEGALGRNGERQHAHYMTALRQELHPSVVLALLAERDAAVRALTLAANRLDRLALEQPAGSERRHEVCEWVDEARATIRARTETTR